MARKASDGRVSLGGENGTESPATARNTSGRSSAELQAIGAPQSWPTTTACVSPSASTRATLSATRHSMRYSSTDAGFDERP